MATIAISKALKVLDTYGLSSFFLSFSEIKKIIDNEGIILNTYPFKGRLKERYICTEDGIAQITIKSGVEPPEAKHLVAHALGHHFLHKGSYAYIDSIVLDKQECQAEDFAAMLLVPPSPLLEVKLSSFKKLAAEFEVPVRLAKRRMEILGRLGV